MGKYYRNGRTSLLKCEMWAVLMYYYYFKQIMCFEAITIF